MLNASVSLHMSVTFKTAQICEQSQTSSHNYVSKTEQCGKSQSLALLPTWTLFRCCVLLFVCTVSSRSLYMIYYKYAP